MVYMEQINISSPPPRLSLYIYLFIYFYVTNSSMSLILLGHTVVHREGGRGLSVRVLETLSYRQWLLEFFSSIPPRSVFAWILGVLVKDASFLSPSPCLERTDRIVHYAIV